MSDRDPISAAEQAKYLETIKDLPPRERLQRLSIWQNQQRGLRGEAATNSEPIPQSRESGKISEVVTITFPNSKNSDNYKLLSTYLDGRLTNLGIGIHGGIHIDLFPNDRTIILTTKSGVSIPEEVFPYIKAHGGTIQIKK